MKRSPPWMCSPIPACPDPVPSVHRPCQLGGHPGLAMAAEAGGLYACQAQLKNSVDQAVSSLEILHKDMRFPDRDTRKFHAALNIGGMRYGRTGKDYFFILDENGHAPHDAGAERDGYGGVQRSFG